MRRLALLCSLLCALLVALPATAQPKCDKGSAKKPLVEGPVLTLSGPDGPIAPHRMASVIIDCWVTTMRLEGLVDANGKLLVPAIYKEVQPITATMAAVQHKINGTIAQQIHQPWYPYIYGKGEQKAPLPYVGFSEFFSTGNTRYPYAYNSQPGVFEYFIFADASETPRVLSNLGGKAWRHTDSPFMQHGDLLIVNFTAADGSPVSQILTLKGEPVSPVIGGVEKWETKPATNSFAYQQNPYEKALSTEYLSAAYNLEHPDLPYGRIYIPIAKNGTPLPLPAEMLGVFPLKAEAKEFSRRDTFGWALVYAHGDGFRIRWGLGPLEALVARAATLPEIAGMQRLTDGMTASNALIHDVFALRSATDGLWRIVRSDDLDTKNLGADGLAPSKSARAVYLEYVAARFDVQRGIQSQQAEAKARADQSLYGWQDKKYRELLASGTLCANPNVASELHREAMARVLNECGNIGPWIFDRAKAMGVTPEVIAAAQNRYSYRVANAEQAAADRESMARAWEASNSPTNWNAWGNSVIQASKANSDAFIANQRRQYYDNLRAWNTGKNKTCC